MFQSPFCYVLVLNATPEGIVTRPKVHGVRYLHGLNGEIMN